MNRELSNQVLKLNGREFAIQGVIGRGASCVVYRAICPDKTEHLLKEYNPRNISTYRDKDGFLCLENEADRAEFEARLVRFREGHAKQRELRLDSDLKNVTSNVQDIYCANGTEYIDMTCFAGDSYEKVQEKSVYNLLRRMKAVAQVVGNYHRAGLLHLDIKPANIFTLPETCEMVMLFDFDSVVSKASITAGGARSYTLSWAAPEQINPTKRRHICEATDIFAVGEMIFFQLMGRHSEVEARRSFASYSFDHKAHIFENVNPKAFSLLEDLLHHTICVSVKQRYKTTAALIAKLNELIEVTDPRVPFLKKAIPYVQDSFVGRKQELATIHDLLSTQNAVFISGIGGIGKSELVKKYAKAYSDSYDTITLISFAENLVTTIQTADNCPYNVKPFCDEKPKNYFLRKVEELRKLSTPKDLIIVDNMDVANDPNINILFNLGAKVLITTRSDFSGTPYSQLSVNATENPFEIFDKHYHKPLTESERIAVNEIIDIVCGHTLTVELLAKQMMAGRVKPEKMLAKIQEGGISDSGHEKVWLINRADGNLIARSMYGHIHALFDLSGLDKDRKYILANLSLIPHTGISTELFHDWCNLVDYDAINALVREGWVRLNEEQDYISLHPVIADILQYEISSRDVHILTKHFSEELTDENTGEVILSVVPFSFANALAKKILKQIQQRHIEPTREIARCIAKFGEFFFEQDLFELAEKSYCLAQEVNKQLNTPDTSLHLEIVNNLALLYDRQGELLGKVELSEKALRYYMEILEIIEVSGTDLMGHIGTIYGNIGSVYHTLNNYDSAEHFYQKALETSDRYTFRTNIGVLYGNMGNYYKALEMHQEAMKKAVEHDEPELVIALIEHNIAVSYKRLGMLNNATTHCENALRIREKLLNPEVSYDLALSKSLLGQIYIENGVGALWSKAERLLTEALTSLGKIVGSSHAEYQTALGFLNSFSKKE